MRDPGHTFSQRTSWDLGASDLSIHIAAARSAGRPMLDLTVSNPTLCRFATDSRATLQPLLNEAALTYDPDPRGMRVARQAVVAYYSDHGAAVPIDAITLTTSTSEAYSFLFRLLCDSGDEVLVAEPSYPLFSFLAELDDVQLRPYPLFYDFGWWIDFAELEQRIGPRTRAILVVHPNNPTGHWTHQPERERLVALCVRHGLALIVDEVFLDFPIGPTLAESFAVGPHPALIFVLSGISKIVALPQMKVAWVVALGPTEACEEALARLEVIADTFLSMNAPCQLALPQWLAGRALVQGQIRARVIENLAALDHSGLDVLRVEAGWSAIVKLREGAAEALLAGGETGPGVIVHPGSFYGLADTRLVVVSLLTPVEIFHAGTERMAVINSSHRLGE